MRRVPLSISWFPTTAHRRSNFAALNRPSFVVAEMRADKVAVLSESVSVLRGTSAVLVTAGTKVRRKFIGKIFVCTDVNSVLSFFRFYQFNLKYFYAKF